MPKHSPLGASGAYRWFECPGSVAMIAKAPPQEPSEYAARGTAAHEVLEICFPDKDPWDYLHHEMSNGVTMDNEDIEAVVEAIDMIHEEMEDGKYTLFKEAAIELETIHPGLFGTADIVLVSEDLSKLKVIDYKHGKGIPVNVENNLQLLYYGLGAINLVSKNIVKGVLDILGWGDTFTEVHIGIIQPRCRHPDGSKRMWQVPIEKLNHFADQLREKARATEKKDAHLSAGPHCRFCPALAMCPQFHAHTSKLAKTDFQKVSDPKNLNIPEANLLTADEIAKVLSFSSIIGDWLKQVDAHAQRMLDHGEKIPGYKLVRKTTRRKWIDEDDASSDIGLILDHDDMFETKLKSPAQMEKALGKKDKYMVDVHTIKPEGGITVVPEHDKREAVAASAKTDFSELEG